jgi:hypothetical protein
MERNWGAFMRRDFISMANIAAFVVIYGMIETGRSGQRARHLGRKDTHALRICLS